MLNCKAVLYCAVAVLIGSATTRGSIYYTTVNSGSGLGRFDTVTAATTIIGGFSTGGTYGLAIDSAGTAYTLRGSNAILATVNLATAALTTIGGPGGFFGYALDFANDGTLYAVSQFNQIFKVNTGTGAFTFVSNLSGPAIDVMDITFDQLGDMYGVGPSDNLIYKINPTTGVSTLAYVTTLGNLMGIATDTNGDLIATSWTSPSFFERVNKASGTSVLVGAIGAGTSFDHGGDIQLAQTGTVPEPLSVMVWLGLIAATVVGSVRRTRG